MTGPLRIIWNLSEGHRLRYLGAIAALVVASCFLYLAPLVAQAAIDGVIAPGNSTSAEPSAFVRFTLRIMGGAEFIAANLWWPGLLMLLITLCAGVFTYFRGRWSAIACESITARLRGRMYDHIQRLPCRTLDNSETGDLVQRCTSDVETVRVFLSNQVVEIGRALIMLLVPIPLMLAIDWRMTVASLVLVPAIVLFAVVFFVKIKSAFKRAEEAESALTTTIQENLTGIRVVRAFARQEFECAKFDARNGKYCDLDYRLYILLAWYWSISDLMCMIQKAIVVGAGAFWILDGSLPVGAYFYFLTAVAMFIWPVRMMGRIITDLGKAVVAMGRLREILAKPEEGAAIEPTSPLPSSEGSGVGRARILPALRGSITCDRVSFAHRENSPVLHEVSFEIKPGSTFAILGPSGCGKSTIVNLLLRFYDHDSGRILLDGIDLHELDRRFVRAQTATVMQEPFLYSKTVKENVTLGRGAAHDEEIFDATRLACVHDSILEFEKGYGTLVGERGVTLSGGQRQRVALARALVQRPSILILDDALSAVDTETESLILEALKSRRGKQTTILIAHRLSTLMHADRIIVLERGRIVQRGSHISLLEEEGLYRRLWTIQTSVEADVEAEAGETRAVASREPAVAGGAP